MRPATWLGRGRRRVAPRAGLPRALRRTGRLARRRRPSRRRSPRSSSPPVYIESAGREEGGRRERRPNCCMSMKPRTLKSRWRRRWIWVASRRAESQHLERARACRSSPRTPCCYSEPSRLLVPAWHPRSAAERRPALRTAAATLNARLTGSGRSTWTAHRTRNIGGCCCHVDRLDHGVRVSAVTWGKCI